MNHQSSMNETNTTTGMAGAGGLSSSSSSLNLPFTTNPFEETNRFRLEQSVLSPNIFQIAHTSTPDRDTNSLWNIDQRAILYPADIPTDESSLMAQYLYEQRMNNQVSAALETFWSKNKVIIESPLATSAASSSAIRSKFFFQKSGGGGSTSSGSVTDYSGGNPRNTTKRFGSYSVNSPLCVDMKPGTSGGGGYSTNAVYYSANNYQRHYYQQQHHPSSNSENRNAAASSQRGQPRRVAKRDQGSQTVLTLPVNFDLSQIKELRQFFVNNENDQDTEHTSPSRVSASLNNSIRKKLFDPDDLSSTATTTTAMSVAAASGAVNSHHQTILMHPDAAGVANTSHLGNISRLPKPDLPLIHGYLPSVSDDDCFDQSFEFEGRQYSSSPKQNKFRTILCDIGDNQVPFSHQYNDPFPSDDSVFMPPTSNNQLNSSTQRPPKNLSSPNMSPLGFAPVTPEKQIFHFDKQVELLAAGGVASSNIINPLSNRIGQKIVGSTTQSGGSHVSSNSSRLIASPISANLYTKSVTRQHLNRYIHFESRGNDKQKDDGGATGAEASIKDLDVFSEVLSSSKKIVDDDHRRGKSNSSEPGSLSSPNLSPIRLDSLKSITDQGNFYIESRENNDAKKLERLSFVESIMSEEFAGKKDQNSPMNRTDQNHTYHQSESNTTTVNTSSTSREKSLGFRAVLNKSRTSINNSNIPIVAKHNTVNNLTNTFNTQDSCLAGQDTGYQTNSGHLGNGSNSSSGSYGLQFNNTDLTNTTSSNRLFKSLSNRKNLTSMNTSSGINLTNTMSMDDEYEEEANDEGRCSMEEEYTEYYSAKQTGVVKSKKFMKRSHDQKTEKSPTKSKTAGSISINSLQKIQPVESSTPEKLKSKMNGKSGKSGNKLVKTHSSSGVMFTKTKTSPPNVVTTLCSTTNHKTQAQSSRATKSLLAKSKTSHDLVNSSQHSVSNQIKKKPVEPAPIAKPVSFKLKKKVEILKPLSTNNNNNKTVDMSLGDQSLRLELDSSCTMNQSVLKANSSKIVSASDYSSMVIQNARIEFINSLKYLRQKENEIE